METLLQTFYAGDQQVVKPGWHFSSQNSLHCPLRQPFSTLMNLRSMSPRQRLRHLCLVTGGSGVQKVLRTNTRVRTDHSSGLHTKIVGTLQNPREFLRGRESLRGHFPVSWGPHQLSTKLHQPPAASLLPYSVHDPFLPNAFNSSS